MSGHRFSGVELNQVLQAHRYTGSLKESLSSADTNVVTARQSTLASAASCSAEAKRIRADNLAIGDYPPPG